MAVRRLVLRRAIPIHVNRIQRVKLMLLAHMLRHSISLTINTLTFFKMEAVPPQPETWDDAGERNWVRAYRMMQCTREYATAEVSKPHNISLNRKWCTNIAWAKVEGGKDLTLTFCSETSLCSGGNGLARSCKQYPCRQDCMFIGTQRQHSHFCSTFNYCLKRKRLTNSSAQRKDAFVLTNIIFQTPLDNCCLDVHVLQLSLELFISFFLSLAVMEC